MFVSFWTEFVQKRKKAVVENQRVEKKQKTPLLGFHRVPSSNLNPFVLNLSKTKIKN